MTFTLQSSASYPVAIKIDSPNMIYVGCKNTTPFTIYLSAEDNYEKIIQLYARNSNSIPYEQDKWSILIPHWRFLDNNDNIIEEIIPTIYATAYNISGEVIGYNSSAEFYYIDDMPQILTGDKGLFICATVDYSNYPVSIDNLDVPGYTNSGITTAIPLIVSGLIPTQLKITRDGTNSLFDFYWSNTNIPFIVTINGDTGTGCEPILHYIPETNADGLLGGSFTFSIDNLNNNILTWDPLTGAAILSAYDSDNLNIGGYLLNTVKSTSTTNQTTIYAAVSVIYNSQTYYLTGRSELFDILDFTDLNIRRFNESWDASTKLQDLAIPTHIHDNFVYWKQYWNALFGSKYSDEGKSFGRQSYEKISNFIHNHANIETCNLSQLYDLAEETDVVIDDYNFSYPPLLRRIMDIVSVNQQRLWGARCTCNMNLDTTYSTYISGGQSIVVETLCKRCNHYHGGNKGNSFNPLNYIVSAGIPFIVQDKYLQNRFNIVIPPLSSSILSASLDPCITNSIFSSISTYALSANYYWLLPNLQTNTPSESDFLYTTSRFCFYDYINSSCNEQIAGLINWDDPFTTLNEIESGIDNWYGSSGNIEKMISYILHQGLGLIEG